MSDKNNTSVFYQKLNLHRAKSNQIRDPENYETLASPGMSSKNVVYYQNRLQPFFSLVREIYEENPDVSNSEVRKYILGILQELNLKYANCTSFKSDSIRLDMCNYLCDHPNEFKSLYKESIYREKEEGKPIHADSIIKYSANKEVSKRQLMSQLISTYREIKRSFPAHIQTIMTKYAKSTPKEKRNFRYAQTTREAKDYITRNEMFFMNEFEGLELFLKDQTTFFSKELKKDYIESIKSTVGILSELGVIDEYISVNNSILVKEQGIPELEITQEEFESIYNDNPDSPLKHLSIAELSVLNAFWINRMTKELSSFSEAFFISNDLDLWDKIKTAPKRTQPLKNISSDDPDEIFEQTIIEVPISPDALTALLEKMRFLEAETSFYFNLVSNNTPLSELEEHDIVDPVTGRTQKRKTAVYRDLTVEAGALQEQIGDDYHHYFSHVNNGILSESQNDFITDFNLYCLAANITHNSYSIKDNIMISQLSNLFTNSGVSKNWGLTKEKRKKGFDRDKLLISIDIPGLNMPHRLHIRRELLEDFLKANQNSTRIPLYQGESDFNRTNSKNSSIIPTPVLLPLSDEKKKKIKSLAKSTEETHPKYRFIQHLASLTDKVTIPAHLKETIGNKKSNTKAKKKFIPRFYDFADGKVYKVIGNGRIVEDTDYALGGTGNVK